MVHSKNTLTPVIFQIKKKTTQNATLLFLHKRNVLLVNFSNSNHVSSPNLFLVIYMLDIKRTFKK